MNYRYYYFFHKLATNLYTLNALKKLILNFFYEQFFVSTIFFKYKIQGSISKAVYKVFLNCYGEYWPWFKQKIKTLYEKNRVDPYPYPPPQSKVKVSRHGTGTDKWPFRNSFTSQFPLESISNMLSIYRLPKSSGPPFFVVSSRSVPDCLLST